MKDYIDRIEYSIVDRCNLNCAYCCHYASIAANYQVSKTRFADDLQRLSEITNGGEYLNTFGILGGEPLMHPDFAELCAIARINLPLSRIRVTTNGLLLNKLSKKDLCILRRYDIEILISKYRDTDDFEAMKNLLEEYHIIYKFCQNNQLVQFYKYSLNENGTNDPIEAHNNCVLWKEQPYYTCHELRDGYLYPCSQIARLNVLNEKFGTKFEGMEQSRIYIYTATKDEIVEFLDKAVPCCKYCNTKQWDNDNKGTWKKSTKSKDEFI